MVDAAPSDSPLANTVYMLFERMQRCEEELGGVKAELAAAKEKLAVGARFEAAIDGIRNVPGFACSLDDFLESIYFRSESHSDREEQRAWLHAVTRTYNTPDGSTAVREDAPLDAGLVAFLETHSASPKLDVFRCNRTYDVRYALWLAAREDRCGGIGVFRGRHDFMTVIRATPVPKSQVPGSTVQDRAAQSSTEQYRCLAEAAGI